MTPGKHRFSPEDFNVRMDACGISPKMKDYLNRVVTFHDAPGSRGAHRCIYGGLMHSNFLGLHLEINSLLSVRLISVLLMLFR